MTERTIRAGELIFREGEESDKAYIIRSGQVEIYKRINQGTLLLATLGEGEIFGEMGVISDAPRTAYASAVGDVTVTELSRDAFFSIMAGEPEEVVLVVRALMERLREANAKVTKLMNKQAQFQLAGQKEVPPISRIIIAPLTGFLKEKMQSNGVVTSTLPYRVGGLPLGAEANPLDWNNLFIKNADANLISRNHFAIGRGEHGAFISDRGSRTGTIVNDVPIGAGAEKNEAYLQYGDNTVIAGGSDSPYRFCISWE